MILKNFVVFEGLDGAGTTSQLTLLKERFTAKGKGAAVHFTAEPTDNPIGKLIRQALSGAVPLHANTIAYLFGADRCEHLYGTEGIVHCVQSGGAVFSDRYLFSSLAYQGLAAGQDLPAEINSRFPLPEYVFFFELPAAIAMERIKKRNTPQEIYEKERFQAQVAESYTRIFNTYAQTAPDMHIITLNAACPIEEIHQKIWSIVKDMPKI